MANDILIPGARDRNGLCETGVFCFRGRWIRLETVRVGQTDSLIPDRPHAQIRDLDTGEIITVLMVGYELHHGIVWQDNLYVVATDYWGLYMSRSFDLTTWSQPKLVFDSERSTFIHYQNNTIIHDGERFVMGLDLLGGPYDFTICFAESRDLQSWHYIPGAVYRPHMYTSCPQLYYVNGLYYLLHVRRRREWIFDTYVSRSSDLLVWEDSPKNPILSPDLNEYLPAHDPRDATLYQAVNASDLHLYERDGKTIGYYHVGTQKPGPEPYLRRADYDGTLAEFFLRLYE